MRSETHITSPAASRAKTQLSREFNAHYRRLYDRYRRDDGLNYQQAASKAKTDLSHEYPERFVELREAFKIEILKEAEAKQ
jgi:hypothetical protein